MELNTAGRYLKVLVFVVNVSEMSLKVWWDGEWSLTELARVWLLPGVGSDVSGQVGWAGKRLGTELALILLLRRRQLRGVRGLVTRLTGVLELVMIQLQRREPGRGRRGIAGARGSDRQRPRDLRPEHWGQWGSEEWGQGWGVEGRQGGAREQGGEGGLWLVTGPQSSPLIGWEEGGEIVRRQRSSGDRGHAAHPEVKWGRRGQWGLLVPVLKHVGYQKGGLLVRLGRGHHGDCPEKWQVMSSVWVMWSLGAAQRGSARL